MTDKVKEAAERLERSLHTAYSMGPDRYCNARCADLRTVLSALRERGEALAVPDGHNLNTPWAVGSCSTIVDCTGVPIAQGLGYTSVAKKRSDTDVTYNHSEYAGPIRARLIVEAVNRAALKDAPQ